MKHLPDPLRRETLSWDVRTKHVTFDPIPTLEHVKGLAVYGPGATLFTVGPNGTVQQFDLNSPSIMVANVQHAVNLLPPSPPNSVEEPGAQSSHSVTTIHTSGSESSSLPFEVGVSESDEEHMSPFARLSRRTKIGSSGGEGTYDSASPVSSRSGVSSLSKSSTGSRTPGHHPSSLKSKGKTENTYISAGSSLKSSRIGGRDLDGYSMGYSLPSTSVPSMASSRSRHRPSRLRHEVPRSPDDNKVHDLFKFTRTRLSDIPYKHPASPDMARLTNDDLRRQMLSTIFGWHKEVEDLIRDEMSHHPAGSANRILLAKWLGEMDADIMAASSENMSSSDWMLLALSGIGGQQSQHKLGRAYVQRLLESGDIHVAVTIMLGMGDHNDAIEVYVSHRRHMEALILTCVAFPSVWERQSAIVRKWGEWAVQHGQQQLAIRCFACTDQESSEPWTSPSAVQLNFQNIAPSIPEILSPPLSPPGIQRGPQRSIAKTSALKLITSFGDRDQKSNFYAQVDGGQTPIAAGVTPIAESAVSPSAYDAATAFLRPSTSSRFNTPTSARTAEINHSRGRLPSIGETAFELNKEALNAARQDAHIADSSWSGFARVPSVDKFQSAPIGSLQRASTASPMMMRDGHQKLIAGCEGDRPPSPNQDVLTRMQATESWKRNGSRDRIPRGVNLHLRSVLQPDFLENASPEQSVTSSTRFHWPSRRRGPGSITSSVNSTCSAEHNLRTSQQQHDDHVDGRDAGRHQSSSDQKRQGSTERSRGSSRGRHESRERRGKPRDASEERGRTSARGWGKPKRSPTSPIPMSPEDLANLSAPKYFDIGELTAAKNSGNRTMKLSSRTSSRGTVRHSPDGRPRPLALNPRGRSAGREESHNRSPSSPVPFSATAAVHYQDSEDEQDLEKALLAQKGFRSKHSRSASLGGGSSLPALRSKADKLDSYRVEALEITKKLPPLPFHERAVSTEHAGDLRQMKDERQRKKEQAARELEERRKSLAQRSQAAQIPHPSEFNGGSGGDPTTRIGIEMADTVSSDDILHRPATEPPKSMYPRAGLQIGLPATPKAMRLMVEYEIKHKTVKEAPPALSLSDVTSSRSRQEGSELSPTEKQRAEPLTLLPSTVYQPPKRLAIPRSMSAPIPDQLCRTASFRKGNTSEVRSIDQALSGPRRHSQEEATPPSPPPLPTPPPMLKELQHLAMPPPPPPPPAPSPFAQRPQPGGALGSGMIEIVTDEDDHVSHTTGPNDGMLPVLSPPVSGHRRGRSVGEARFSGRGARSGELMRSVSRGRKGSIGSIRSPHPELSSESCRQSMMCSPIAAVGLPVRFDVDTTQCSIEPAGSQLSTGLHRSELI